MNLSPQPRFGKNTPREGLTKLTSIYWAARAPFIFRTLKLPPNAVLLDLGCSSGLWSRHFTSQGMRVIGLDLDSKTLRAGQQIAFDQGSSWPAFCLASAESLPLSDETVDAIICLDMLDIVPHDRQAAEELIRVLKPGGQLLITVISKHRRQIWTKIAFAEHLRNYSQSELQELLKQVGFVLSASFTFYRRIGGLAREAGALSDRSGLGKIPGLNAAISLVLSSLTRLDTLLPEHSQDGGFGLSAYKP